MSAMKAALDEIKKIAEELITEGHKLAAPLVAWIDKVMGDLPAAEAAAKTDAAQVVTDAVKAEEPVAAEAVKDAEHVAEVTVEGTAAPKPADAPETKTS